MEEKKTRKERSDKGVARGCRWTDKGYHKFLFRLSDDLYEKVNEKRGDISMNQYLNDLIRTAIEDL